MIIVGEHITWFLCGPTYRWIDPKGGKWFDKGASDGREGPYALQGTPIDTEGFAISNRGTLGGYFQFRIPKKGIDRIIRQIDIGPRKPVIDLSAPLAYALFGSKDNFPDWADWRLDYIGMHEPTVPPKLAMG